jgi:hypothetical protein
LPSKLNEFASAVKPVAIRPLGEIWITLAGGLDGGAVCEFRVEFGVTLAEGLACPAGGRTEDASLRT